MLTKHLSFDIKKIAQILDMIEQTLSKSSFTKIDSNMARHP